MTTARAASWRHSSPLRAAVVPSVAAGVLCAVVAGLVGGSAGLLGAVVGTAMVVGFFGFGQVVQLLAQAASPSALMVVAMTSYLLQVVVLLAIFAAFRRHPSWADTVSTDALGLTVLVCTLVWTTGLVVASRRERIPLYDLEGDRG